VSPIETFSKHFPFQVWKIHYTQNHLLVELRDSELRVLKLMYLSLDSMEVLAESDQDILSWWDNVVYVYGNYVAISTYKDPKFPDTQGVKVLDIVNGNLLWQEDSWRILEGNTDCLSVVKDPKFPLRVEKVQIASGELTVQNSEIAHSDLHLPELYTEGDVFFEQVAEFLAAKQFKPEKVVEYLDYCSLILIGIYTNDIKNDLSVIQASILVFDSQGKLLNNYKCGHTEQGIGMGMYFVVKDRLVFVRDKKEIVILELSHCNKK